MTDEVQQPDAVSRRGLIAGAAALGAGIVALTPAGHVHAAPPPTEAIGTQSNGLTYLQLDALAFFPYTVARVYQTSTGVQPVTTPNYIATPLLLPVGSVVTEISVAYQVQPILTIMRRQMSNPDPPVDVFTPISLAAGGGAKTQTVSLPTPVTIEYGSTYTLQFFCSAGDSVLGATVGYLPPTRAFIPYQGLNPPRVLDTRESGGIFSPGEERTLALGFPGARGAVLNVTATGTEGSGFVAVFRADIAWPGNSSLNWDHAGQNIANGVITDVDAAGQIKIRAGANRTHVVVDRIGWLI
jgi:hypothetical protein